MAKTDAQRGPFGAWLRAARKARPGSGRDGKMTAAEVRQALIRERGFGIAESPYAELESGTALPTDEQRSHLEAWAGSQAPGSFSGHSDDLAAAIREQAAAIERLAKALERDREEAPAWAQAVVDAVLAGRRLLSTDVERVEREGSGTPQRDRVT